MIIQESLRYFKSKISIILTIILSIIVAASYYSTYLEKKEWIDVLNSGDADVDLQLVSEITAGYSGSYYFESFLFSNDYNSLVVIVLLICFGVSISSKMFETLQTNYGTMVISRTRYKTYLKKTLISQIIYMASYIAIFFLAVFFISLFISNTGLDISANSFAKGASISAYLSLFVVTIIQLSIYVISIVLISSLSPVFLKNKYIIQFFPFIIIMITYLIGNVLGNINNSFAFITSFFILDNILFSIQSFFNSSELPFTIIMRSTLFIIFSLVILYIIYKANIKKFSKDYLV